MENIVCLHAKSDIEAFARRNPLLHLYEIGDLDDFFWTHTTWYGLSDKKHLQQLVLLYTDMSVPVVLANAEPPVDSMGRLIRALLPVLPGSFYAHIHPNVIGALADDYDIAPHGAHNKMGLTHASRLSKYDTAETVRLSSADLFEIEALYRESYPGNWFVPRMLETGCYYGIRRDTLLVCVAGVHVYSHQYRVAALGNVTTHPKFRGQGLATIVSAKLCQELLRNGIQHIGLNVKADNIPAITCYENIGFERVAEYGEYMLNLKRSHP